MILRLCKVGPVDLCRNVWICIDLQGKYKGKSTQMHTKSTHFNNDQLVQGQQNHEILSFFFIFFFK